MNATYAYSPVLDYRLNNEVRRLVSEMRRRAWCLPDSLTCLQPNGSFTSAPSAEKGNSMDTDYSVCFGDCSSEAYFLLRSRVRIRSAYMVMGRYTHDPLSHGRPDELVLPISVVKRVCMPIRSRWPNHIIFHGEQI